jgi:hypothetical protein
MEFLDIGQNTQVFCSMLFPISSTCGFHRKPHSPLVLKIHTQKIQEARKLESINECILLNGKKRGKKTRQKIESKKTCFFAQKPSINGIQKFQHKEKTRSLSIPGTKNLKV